MNINKLKHAEKRFFDLYPNGFKDEELQATIKKHKVLKMTEFTRNAMSKESLSHPLQAIEAIKKVVTRSSLVSVFEKTKFRNLINEADDLYKRDLVDAFYVMFHKNQEQGFTQLVRLLEPYKMAKWPIITSLLLYFDPTVEVLIKPTTVKHIIKELDITDVDYTPKMNYAFYKGYRKVFNDMQQYVDSSLSESNGAFSGFLMMML